MINFFSVINLYSRKPDGLFCLLNENAPGQCDNRLISRFDESNESDRHCYQRNEMGATFSIHHYAGWVEYNISGFTEKNRDVVASGSLQVLRSSKCWLMRSATAQSSKALWRWRILHRMIQAAAGFRKRYKIKLIDLDERETLDNKIDRAEKMLKVHNARNALPSAENVRSYSNGRTTTSLQYQQVLHLLLAQIFVIFFRQTFFVFLTELLLLTKVLIFHQNFHF